MFYFCQFPSYAIHVHDSLGGIVMTQNFCIEFAKLFCFALCYLITSNEGFDFIRETIVRGLELIRLCKLGGQSIETERSAQGYKRNIGPRTFQSRRGVPPQPSCSF